MAKTKQRTTKSRSSKSGAGKPASRGKPRRTEERKPTKAAVAASKPPQASAVPPAPERASKKGSIASLLRRTNGASIAELTEATGWQQHSVRAAMTGLRKAGGEITRNKDADGVSRFRLTGHG